MASYNGNHVHSHGIVRNSDTKTLYNGAAVTANGNGSSVDVSAYTEGLLVINISAASGTSPTANFYLETYDSVSTKWVTVPSVTVPQQTTTTATPLIYAATNFGNTVRIRWAVGGTTPNFTFTAALIAKS